MLHAARVMFKQAYCHLLLVTGCCQLPRWWSSWCFAHSAVESILHRAVWYPHVTNTLSVAILPTWDWSSVQGIRMALSTLHAAEAATSARCACTPMPTNAGQPMARIVSQWCLPSCCVAWQVISIESNLHSVARPDLAGLLRQVQEREREKLRLTLSW